jgi:hypothetical protein
MPELSTLWPFFAMALVGLVMHFAKTMVSLRQGGEIHLHIGDYLRDHPYQTALSVGMGLVGVVILAEANQLTLAAAFGLGYISDSATDLVKGRVAKVYQ